MRSVRAVFKKQLKGTVKNPEILIQFIIFPLLAFVLNLLMVTDFEGVPDDIVEIIVAGMPNMVTMQATIFAGMGLITVMAGIVAEDIEKKSLRFLMMAGVKPQAYLLGVSSVIFIASFFTSVAFSFVGAFNGLDFWIFTGAMMSGVTGSIVLGASIGMLVMNQQSASAFALPIAIILGFGPMMAQFNDRIGQFLHFIYTQQLNVIANYLTTGGGETPLWQSFVIIWANVLVLIVLFCIAFVKKGLRA